MDKNKYMAEAKNFMGEGDGYLHSEMKNGKAPQLVMSGDVLATMWQVCGILTRISEITGTSFEDTCGMTFSMPKLGGYANVSTISQNKDKKVYVGDDWNEQWQADKEREIKRKNSSDSISLAFNLAEMEKRNISLNNQLVDLKKDYAKKLKAKDEQIKALSKECQALEHRLEEMERRNMFNE